MHQKHAEAAKRFCANWSKASARSPVQCFSNNFKTPDLYGIHIVWRSEVFLAIKPSIAIYKHVSVAKV